MTMPRRRADFLAFLFALLLLPLSSAEAGEGRVLRFGLFIPDRVVHVREVVKPWVAGLNEDMAGEAEIRLYPGGALGRDGDMQWRATTTGVLDLTWFPTGYVAGRFPAIEIFDFPLLSDDPMTLTIALWRLYERGYLKGLEGVRALALSVSPAYNFHLAFPLETLDDLKGRKIRVVNRSQAVLVEALGAKAIAGISATQAAESLSRGLIDGALFSWHATRAIGIDRVTESHILAPVAFSPSVLIINEASYARLPEAARRAIDARSGEALSIAFTQSLIREAEASRARAEADPKHRLYRPDADEHARMRDVFRRLGDDWTGGDPERERLLAALRGLLAEIAAERGAGS